MFIQLLFLFFFPVTQFEIKDGDRIVMVGGALIEREQQFGYLELMLHIRYPDRKFTVRNLGWSGDTVWGEARAGFGTQADGYRTLVEQVKAARPTVLILGYGTSEAFAGKAGVEKFARQFRQQLADVAQPDTRCIFLTIPSPKLANVSPVFAQEAYDTAIKALAKERNGIVVDINQLYQPTDSRTLTDDGILPNEWGYQHLAKTISSYVGEFDRHSTGTFTDNKPLALQPKNLESLRQLIIRKNELYFHQYRPQNNTYLFLFRKHEQGNNAKEIPQFEPLIAELDAKINELKKQK